MFRVNVSGAFATIEPSPSADGASAHQSNLAVPHLLQRLALWTKHCRHQLELRFTNDMS